jgi:hypothetical protein
VDWYICCDGFSITGARKRRELNVWESQIAVYLSGRAEGCRHENFSIIAGKTL